LKMMGNLKKAFNVCSYQILLRKLVKFGIKVTTLLWFKNYWSGRAQCVEINGIVEDQDEDALLFTLSIVHLFHHIFLAFTCKTFNKSVPFQPLSISLLYLVTSVVSLCEHHTTFFRLQYGRGSTFFLPPLSYCPHQWTIFIPLYHFYSMVI
jgi:hypothetical protein